MEEILPITVVIPCYNCENTINRTVDSIIKQSCWPLEIILINDASSDNTLEIISSMKHEKISIRVINNKLNRGVSYSRNLGWSEAVGTYIAFIDSDDTWHPQKLKVQYNFMEKHPIYDMTAHSIELRDDTINYPENFIEENYNYDTTISVSSLLISNKISPISVMIKKTYPLRFEENKRYMEDYQLWIDILANNGKICFLNLVLSYIHKRPGTQNGLSSKLIKMQLGEMKSIVSFQKKGYISIYKSLIILTWTMVKFIRRLVLIFIYNLKDTRRKLIQK